MFRRGNLKRQKAGQPVSARNLAGTVSELERVQHQMPGFGLAGIGTAGGLFTRFAQMFVMLAMTDGDGVSERSGSQLGRGNAQLMSIQQDASGNATLLTVGGNTVPVYHLGSQPVAANTWVILLRIYGVLIVIWEDCPAS